MRWTAALAALTAALICAASASAQTLMYQERMGLPFHGAGSEWTTPLASNAPIDPESANLVGVMDQWFPGPAGNKANFTISNGISWWIAPPGQATVPVGYSGGGSNPFANVWAAVPIPPGAHPSLGSDERMAVLQPSTGCTWEFWHLVQAQDGSWSAAWGGRDCGVFSDIGVYKNVEDAAGNVLEQNNWGGPATGFDSMAGAMMVDELAHGTIPHAVAIATDFSATCATLRVQPADG